MLANSKQANSRFFIGLTKAKYQRYSLWQVDGQIIRGLVSQGIGKTLWVWGISLGLAASAFAESPSLGSATNQAASAWTPSATIAVKEAFDENVFLQSVSTNAFQHSAITTLLPSVGLSFKPADAFHAALNYGAEINFFHSASREDFTLHRALFGLDGEAEKTKWELSETFLVIDGSDVGPSFFGPGGPPAGGAPQIRDRRAAMVERGQVKVTQSFESWFIRPTLTGYYHDFETIQQTTPGYQNYVDRDEWNAGADLGRLLTDKTWLTIGYRYGEQQQAKLLDFPEHYDSRYQRALVGVEGKPWSWLGLSIAAGPEFRRYGSAVASGFTRQETYGFVEASVTLLPGASDVVGLSARSFEQPGFSGRSAYLDSTYEMTWRHKLTQKLTLGIGLRAYNTDFLEPIDRNDWIITPNVLAAYTLNSHLSGEVSYLFDDAFSKVPQTQGREYTRQVVAVGLRYSF